jgi:hypothetical protein
MVLSELCMGRGIWNISIHVVSQDIDGNIGFYVMRILYLLQALL